MHKLGACIALCVAAALTGSATAAPTTKSVRPTVDGPMTIVAEPDGPAWAAWAYRFAYRAARGVGLIHVPTPGNANETDGIADGPEPSSGLGQKGLPVPTNGGPAPASTRTP